MTNIAGLADHERTSFKTERVTVMPPRNCDAEVADMMDKLSHLQTWCTLMACKDSGASAAIGIVQDARCLIVERLYTKRTPSPQAAQ